MENNINLKIDNDRLESLICEQNELLRALLERFEQMETVAGGAGSDNGGAAEWLDMQAAMKYLGVSRSTIYKLIGVKAVPRYRGGPKGGKNLFKRADLDHFLENSGR